MPPFDHVFSNAHLIDGRTAHVAVDHGRIAAVVDATDPAPAAREATDLGGQMLVPGFVEGHIHLDTSFYGDAWKPHLPCTNGFDVRERVAFQMQNIANAAPMAERARNSWSSASAMARPRCAAM